jgi:hypothetical protein
MTTESKAEDLLASFLTAPKVKFVELGQGIVWALNQPMAKVEIADIDLKAIAWKTSFTLGIPVEHDDLITGGIRLEADSEQGVTWGRVLEAVYENYNSPLKHSAVRLVRRAVRDNYGGCLEQKHLPPHMKPYHFKALRAIDNGKPVRWIDLMGGKVHFDHLSMDPHLNEAWLYLRE